jgi:hypothetical protein
LNAATCLYKQTTPTYPLGWGQTFIYQELSVTLNAKSFHYGPKNGTGTFLNMWAYYRKLSEAQQPKTFFSDLGETHWEGKRWNFHEFDWRLQFLTEEIYEDLWEIYSRSHADKASVRLLDGRQAMVDYVTRKRARVGPLLPAIANRPSRIRYWPQFNIELILEGDRAMTGLNEYSLVMTAKEYGPNIPVALTEDRDDAPFLI